MEDMGEELEEGEVREVATERTERTEKEKPRKRRKRKPTKRFGSQQLEQQREKQWMWQEEQRQRDKMREQQERRELQERQFQQRIAQINTMNDGEGVSRLPASASFGHWFRGPKPKINNANDVALRAETASSTEGMKPKRVGTSMQERSEAIEEEGAQMELHKKAAKSFNELLSKSCKHAKKSSIYLEELDTCSICRR
jgi:hypothetical protein